MSFTLHLKNVYYICVQIIILILNDYILTLVKQKHKNAKNHNLVNLKLS